MIGVEAELAFLLKRDIEAGDDQIDPAQVLDAVASVHAAIEIVDTRLPDWQNAPPLWKLADNQTNGYFILGSGVEDWRHRDLARHRHAQHPGVLGRGRGHHLERAPGQRTGQCGVRDALPSGAVRGSIA